MITLEEYKNYLLNNYKYPIDSLPDRVNKRKNLLNRNYSDEFLKTFLILIL